MAIKEIIRGTIRGSREVELDRDLNLPLGSAISITISSGWNGSNNDFSASANDSIERFKRSAGSWKDVPESFIKEVYDNRHISSRNDVVTLTNNRKDYERIEGLQIESM